MGLPGRGISRFSVRDSSTSSITSENIKQFTVQGSIEEKLDSYNMPYYEPYLEDVQMETEKEGSFLHHLDIIAIPGDGVNRGQKYDRAKTAERLGKVIRAVDGSMLQSHFGSQVMVRLFQRFDVLI